MRTNTKFWEAPYAEKLQQPKDHLSSTSVLQRTSGDVMLKLHKEVQT